MQKNRLFLYYLSLLLLLAILLAVVACEQDEGGVSPQKTPSGRVVSGRNSNLTADAAQAWYEANYFPVVSFAPPQTRSGSDGSDVLIKPMWEATKEYKKGKYELVEMPMLTKAPVLFMDEQTAKVVEQNPEGLKLRNTAKLVIRKNLETGKTESFVMIFVASLKYATEHYKDMGKLSYFKRPADYDGMVLFFELEKGFVNGWRYEEGKITKTIRPSAGTGSPNAPLTRGYYDEVCEAVYTYYSYWEEAPEPGEERIWDEELGAWELSAVNAWSLVEGYDVSWQCDYEWVPEPGDDEEEDQDDGGYYPPTPPPTVSDDEPVGKYYDQNGNPCGTVTRGGPSSCLLIILPGVWDKKYPKAAEAIRKGLAKHSTEDNLAEFIAEKTGRDVDRVKRDLIDGKGPRFKAERYTGSQSNAFAQFDLVSNRFTINEKYVQMYEQDQGVYNGLLELAIVASVIHEFVHYNELAVHGRELLIEYYMKHGTEINSHATEIELFGGIVEFSPDGNSIIVRKP